ncbi:hypothetical protein NDU88_002442 [Pleurodeles waltl]|uniref:Uncharacterized protein n=1 Tax=Pleurodeles waltl TaxID=8319 RepID=A0AAV7SD87_PLEWA|nr:hypothetical protein NDU88_002442 [Pleurodeles waltl]
MTLHTICIMPGTDDARQQFNDQGKDQCKPRCINGLFLPPSGNIVSETETRDGNVPLTITEALLKNASSISRPIHPPLIITIDLDEDEDEEDEEDEESCKYDFIAVTFSAITN